MKPKNIDPQDVRRKNAILGAASSTLLRTAAAIVLLWLRAGLDPSRLAAKAFLIAMVLDLGSIPFIWISLKIRLKEIQGGEEDAAAQY